MNAHYTHSVVRACAALCLLYLGPVPAANVALNKPYTLSPLPNYTLSAPTTDKTALTDGRLTTTGTFWVQKSTVGWSGGQSVSILIDLGKLTNVSRISFSTARGDFAGVRYPSLVTAFLGNTKDAYVYAGNVIDSTNRADGPYEKRTFSLDGINMKARYVLLRAESSGSFMFTDEIAVEDGASARSISGTLSLKATEDYLTGVSRLNSEKAILLSLVNRVLAASPDATTAASLSPIRSAIENLSSLSQSDGIESQILAVRRAYLVKRIGNRPLLVSPINPWQRLTPVDDILSSASVKINLQMPLGGSEFFALLVTNLKASSSPITVNLPSLVVGAPELEASTVDFIKTAVPDYIADPVLPLESPLTLRSGESRIIWVSAKAGQPGAWSANLSISNGTNTSQIPLAMSVANVQLPEGTTLNSNNWAYFNVKPLNTRTAAGAADLASHGINVMVVPAGVIPNGSKWTAGERQDMIKYISNQKGASKVLFYLGFNNPATLGANRGLQFMSQVWQTWFVNLHNSLIEAAAAAGYRRDQVYLYPFDEVHDADVSRLITLSSWIHTRLPGTKVFATIERTQYASIATYVDLAQVIDRPDMIAAVKGLGREFWLYGATENTKSLSPYGYYRLKAWKAYYYGFKGVGFWAYADTGWQADSGTSWDDFDGLRPDFAVVYENGESGFYSSRRWEAWRAGLEDYDLLVMYERRFGAAPAKALAKSVIDQPENLTLVDAVRNSILTSLAR